MDNGAIASLFYSGFGVYYPLARASRNQIPKNREAHIAPRFSLFPKIDYRKLSATFRRTFAARSSPTPLIPL